MSNRPCLIEPRLDCARELDAISNGHAATTYCRGEVHRAAIISNQNGASLHQGRSVHQVDFSHEVHALGPQFILEVLA